MTHFNFTAAIAAMGIAVVIGATANTASAQIEYIDAIAAGMTGTVNTVGPVSVDAGATNWQIRGNDRPVDGNQFSNGGSALQYTTDPVDASNPTLTTTISGLDAAKIYDVFVFIWDDLNNEPNVVMPADSPWDIAAKLSTDASYTQYDSSSGHVVTDNAGLVAGVDAAAAGYTVINFDDITGLNVLGQNGDADGYDDAYDGNRAMFGFLLPSQVSGTTSFSVDLQPGTNSTQRSWYDGIGLRVIPEPTSLALIGFGLAGLAFPRRRS